MIRPKNKTKRNSSSTSGVANSSTKKSDNKNKKVATYKQPEVKKSKKESLNNVRVNLKFKTNKQKDMYNSILKNRIIFVKGSAGTGKTIIALKAALDILNDKNKNIDTIVLIRSIVQSSMSKMGELPGDEKEKTSNYFSVFYENLIKLIGSDSTKYLKESGYIEERLVNFVRGSTFGTYDDTGKPIGRIVIVDEAQNLYTSEMKTLISRIGEDTVMVFLGDTDQIDIKLKTNEKDGLTDAIDRLSDLDKIDYIEFTEDDIVRDPFLKEIMKRYKQ